jgi:hypothetical protein
VTLCAGFGILMSIHTHKKLLHHWIHTFSLIHGTMCTEEINFLNAPSPTLRF